MKRTAILLALAFLASGCATIGALIYRGPTLKDCGGPIPSVGEIGVAYLDRRLRVEIRSEDIVEGFEVVLQKRGNRLVVLGLNRFGGKAFAIEQIEDRITVDSPLEPIERVSPRTILRELYIWPLEVARPHSGVTLELAPDGTSALLIHERCGFTTRIVDLQPSDG